MGEQVDNANDLYHKEHAAPSGTLGMTVVPAQPNGGLATRGEAASPSFICAFFRRI
jgi:hypothetical protein